MAVKDYSTNPDENTTISGINIAEGCPPSGINNAIRQLMADVKQNDKVMTGATASAAGTSGNVPAPQAGQNEFFLRGDGTWAVSTGLPLGHLFTWPFSTPPDGSIIVNGATYSRTLYADLWTYISSKSDWVKTESEWQSIASANNGYCPYYSDGDGSTTFRVPKFAPYQQIALSSASAGTYHEAGLPNTTGFFSATVPDDHGYSAQGVFSGSFHPAGSLGPVRYRVGGDADPKSPIYGYDFSLSKASPIYGKSTTVQPESHDWIVCVVAFGKATNVGNVDVANVMSAVGTVQSDLTNYLPLTGGNVTGAIRLYSGDDYIGNVVTTNDENSGKSILIDTWEQGDSGAFIRLQKGSDKNNPGSFVISARNADGTIYRSLTGHTNGDLLWDNKRIVRSVNGETADANGNVNFSVGNVLHSMGIVNPSNSTGTWIGAPSGYTANVNCYFHACMFQQRVDDDDKIIVDFPQEGNGWRVKGYTKQRNGDGAVIYMIFITR